jgi:aryl-alcohol dehydrogenase-like predicted oxidoreductase
MELRALGATGIDVSPLGLGTVKLGRREGVKYPRDFTLPTDDEARDLLSLARDLGVNLVDTAPSYGTSEERLGPLLEGQRDDWVIVSKTGESFERGQSTFDFSPEATIASVERSLRRLRTDRIDCILVHSDGDSEMRLEELGTLGALRELKSRGLIRAFGVSSKSCAGAIKAIESTDVVMLTLNPRDREDVPAVQLAHERSAGVLVKKALLSGHIDLVEEDPDSPADPIEACLRFVFAHPGVSSAIVGTIDPEHLKHDADAAKRALKSIEH